MNEFEFDVADPKNWITGRFFENEFLDRPSVSNLNEWIDGREWEDGVKSLDVGSVDAHQFKMNEVLVDPVPSYLFWSHLDNNNAFSEFTQPKESKSLFCSKTSVGGYYKPHFDHYTLGHFSTTVFLNDPDEYDGGELVLWIDGKEKFFKPKAGYGVTYETRIGHRVNTVTRGERVALVFWTTSRWADVDLLRKWKYYNYMTKYTHDNNAYDSLNEYCNTAYVNIRTKREDIYRKTFELDGL